MKTLFYQGRHHKISLIITTQKIKDIPHGMRTNCSHIICFNLKNQKEERDFANENAYIADIHKHYVQATKEPYNFLYINKELNKVYHNFETELK